MLHGEKNQEGKNKTTLRWVKKDGQMKRWVSEKRWKTLVAKMVQGGCTPSTTSGLMSEAVSRLSEVAAVHQNTSTGIVSIGASTCK